jgi:DNA-binding transcriptional MerR regulator
MTLWSLHEFLEEVQLAERTLRHWHSLGVLPPAVKQGDAYGYTVLHLARVRAAYALQRRGMRRLADIARVLDATGDMELMQLAGLVPEPPDPHAPLSAPAAELSAAAAAPPAATAPLPAGAEAVLLRELVEIALAPGVTLRIERPIDDEARVLVRSIAALRGMHVTLPW